MKLLPEDQQTFQFIEPNVVIAGLWDNEGVRHYERFVLSPAPDEEDDG